MKKGDLSIVGMDAIDPVAIVAPSDEVGAELRREAKRLKQQVDLDSWAMARVLAEIHEGSLHIAWGFATWAEYVDLDLDFSIRKASYMINTELWMRTLPPEAQAWVRALGFSKARELVGVVTPANHDDWRRKVEGLTYRQLMELLHGGEEGGAADPEGDGDGGAGATDDDLSPWRVNLARAQRENVERALGHAASVVGGAVDDRKGYLLDLICTDYLGSNAAYPDRAAYLARVEATLGVRLLAYSPTDDDVVFGVALLEEMAARADAEAAEAAP